MIARLWRAQIDVSRRAEFEQIGETELVPLLEQSPGFAGVLFLSRDDQAVLLTLWKDQASAERFSDAGEVQSLAHHVREKGIVRGEPAVEILEIHGGSFATKL